MALDVIGTFLNGAQTALNARSAITTAIRPRNFIFTSKKNWPNVLATRKLPADFPCVLMYADSTALTSPVKSFGLGSGCDYPKQITVTCFLRLYFEQLYDDAQLPLEAEIGAALMSTDVSLRASALRPAPLDWQSKRTTESINDALRTTVVWNTTTICRPYYSALTS